LLRDRGSGKLQLCEHMRAEWNQSCLYIFLC